MIERLQHALEDLDELSPEAQEELAQLIEEQIGPLSTPPGPPVESLPASTPPTVRDALALAGAWSDLQGDDEFAALDRIRHESEPTPPADEQLRWLDDNRG